MGRLVFKGHCVHCMRLSNLLLLDLTSPLGPSSWFPNGRAGAGPWCFTTHQVTYMSHPGSPTRFMWYEADPWSCATQFGVGTWTQQLFSALESSLEPVSILTHQDYLGRSIRLVFKSRSQETVWEHVGKLGLCCPALLTLHIVFQGCCRVPRGRHPCGGSASHIDSSPIFQLERKQLRSWKFQKRALNKNVFERRERRKWDWQLG